MYKLKGSILLAPEGINGTIAGTKGYVAFLFRYFKFDGRFENITHKDSYCSKMPFHHSRVKLKKEIVTMGVHGLDPENITGTYVKPKDWNKLISNKEVLVIDTRNEYEIMTGTFKNAMNPKINTFSEFPAYVKKNLNKDKHKKIAMFCTGGIRCEKSTALLKTLGFPEVYHLEGGILKYLEEAPKITSMWQGECFVFDRRMTVDHNLKKGKYDRCYACGLAITEEQKKSEKYQPGSSCHHCYDKLTDKQKDRFAVRTMQQNLAKQRNQLHFGQDSVRDAKLNRDKNLQRKENDRKKKKEADKMLVASKLKGLVKNLILDDDFNVLNKDKIVLE